MLRPLVFALALALCATGAWAQPDLVIAADDCNQSADLDRSIRGCTKIIERGRRKHRAAAYNNRGNAYRKNSEVDRAIADFDKAIALKPNYATAYNNRGTAYVWKDDREQAIADYRTALEIDPSNQLAKNNLNVLGVTP